MHYVYVLLSLKDSRFYTGYTEDLRKRLEEHQQGKVNSTRDRRPYLGRPAPASRRCGWIGSRHRPFTLIAAKIIRSRLWGFPEQAGRAGAAGPVAGRRVRQFVRAPWAGRGSARGTAPRPGGRPAPPRADPEQARPTPSPQTGCRRGPAARGEPPGAGGKARLKRQMNSKNCELT